MAEATSFARLSSEFVGTFLLVFTVGCNVLSGQPVWGSISIGCVLTVMIYALASSSGANFNPAVSLSLALCGKMSWREALDYVCVQLVAGTTAGFCYTGLFGKSFKLGPTAGHSWWQAGIAEMVYTFMLCFVVLNVAASRIHAGRNQFYGIAIGFVIVAAASSGGSVSMGCFNPAVAFGIDLSSGYWLIYTAFECVGAVLAAGAFKVCRGKQEENPLASPGRPAKMLSEFIGTYMLVLTVGLNVLSGSGAAVFSISACLMCMIFALGTVSGAHFNPSVTFAILCSGREKICVEDSISYWIAQTAAGVCAGFTYVTLMNGETFDLKPRTSFWSQVIVAEFIFTFALSFVVLSVATVSNVLSQYFGFAIGMTVMAGGTAIGRISGGSLNPAVTFGISMTLIGQARGEETYCEAFWQCLVYSLVELLAGVSAASVFMITQPSEYETKSSRRHTEIQEVEA